jgi:hypothetical protein
MNKRQKTNQSTSKQIAGRMLMAWKSGDDLTLREEFTRIHSSNARGLSSLEMERMDILGAIAQVLCSTNPRPDQHRAAIRLLEHLDCGKN